MPGPVGPPGGRAATLGPGWLLALMAANTVAAVGLVGDIAGHVGRGPGVAVQEDFLAGWHLVLYGGVAGVAGVLGALALRRGPWAPLRELPAATWGLGALCAGGATDAAWHAAFGVEAALEALVSPPHLVIFLGLVLLMAAPVGAVARGPGRPLDVPESAVLALSVASVLVVTSLFTGYLSPLVGGSELQAGSYVDPLVGTSPVDYDVARGLGASLWFGALVSATVTVVRSRAAPVAGTWTVTFGLLGAAPLVVTGPSTLPLGVALVAYGVASDLTGTRSRPHPLATGLCVAALWAVLIATLAARDEMFWTGEVWGGLVATGFLVGGAVGAAVRWAVPTRSTRSPFLGVR